MYKQRSRYLHLRSTTVPKTEYMRKKYLVEKFTNVLKSLKLDSGVDVLSGSRTGGVDSFLREVDLSVSASRRVINTCVTCRTFCSDSNPPTFSTQPYRSTQQILLPSESPLISQEVAGPWPEINTQSAAPSDWNSIIAKRRQRQLSDCDEDHDTCPICLSYLTSTATTKHKVKRLCLTQCGHVYHESCLASFEKYAHERGQVNSCPICRMEYIRIPYQV